MPYRIISNTRPSINLVERRLLTDVVGDYLRAYDDMVDGDAIQTARQIMADRPEFKRLGALMKVVRHPCSKGCAPCCLVVLIRLMVL